MSYAAPAATVYAAPAPVPPAPAKSYASPAPTVNAASGPVVEYGNPAPAVSFAAPALVRFLTRMAFQVCSSDIRTGVVHRYCMEHQVNMETAFQTSCCVRRLA